MVAAVRRLGGAVQRRNALARGLPQDQTPDPDAQTQFQVLRRLAATRRYAAAFGAGYSWLEPPQPLESCKAPQNTEDVFQRRCETLRQLHRASRHGYKRTAERARPLDKVDGLFPHLSTISTARRSPPTATSHHVPPPPTTSHYLPARPTASHHLPPRPTSSHHLPPHRSRGTGGLTLPRRAVK